MFYFYKETKMSEDISNEDYMQAYGLPDLQDIGFRFCRTKTCEEYRHVNYTGLCLELKYQGSDVWDIKPSYETFVGRNRFELGKIVESDTDTILYPNNDLKSDLAAWAKNRLAIQDEIAKTEETLSLPPHLQKIRSIEFDFPGITTVTLKAHRCVWPPQTDEWTVELIYKSGRQIIDVVKHMHEKEFTPDGVRYWFRQIKKWYKEDNDSRRAVTELWNSLCLSNPIGQTQYPPSNFVICKKHL